MEIKREKVDKLIESYKQFLTGRTKPEIKKVLTKDGEIRYSKIENSQGWYAVVCFYDDLQRVDVYDQHVFSRYQERFLGKRQVINVVDEFLKRNGSGVLILEKYGRFSKRVRDGACFGTITPDEKIIYHKTFVEEKMLDPENQYNLLSEEITSYVNN